VHGDQHSYVIGCASIVAKVLRDRLMAFYHTLFPRYAFNRHKGYGTPLHTKRLTRWGPSLLHRLSFRPVKDTLIHPASLHEPSVRERPPALAFSRLAASASP